jgi:hypothetical protein
VSGSQRGLSVCEQSFDFSNDVLRDFFYLLLEASSRLMVSMAALVVH